MAVGINPKADAGQTDFSELAAQIHKNASVFEFGDVPPTNWTSKGFERHVGDIEFLEAPDGATAHSRVTLDFWDTVLGRVRPAEGAKRLTALRFALNEWKLRGYSGQRLSAENLHQKRLDSEAKQVALAFESDALKAISAMSNGTLASARLPEELLESEIRDEIKFTRELVGICSSDFLKDRQVEIVSDFYMSSGVLSEIIADKKTSFEVRKIHSSIDYGQTKRMDGNLFSALSLQDERDWLHIGDSEHSDVLMARKHGAKAHLVSRTSTTSWNRNDLDVISLAKDLQDHFGTDSAGRFVLDLSIVGVSLVSFAVERAISQGRSQVLYLSREGETLAKIHEQLVPHFRDLGLPEIKPIYVRCSRASVFFPSFAGDLQAGFDHLDMQYPVSTSDSIVDSLSLPDDLAELVRMRFGKFQRFRTSKTLTYFDSTLIEKLRAHLDEQAKIFSELLSELGVLVEDAQVCDLGWRGTINDSISRIAGIEIPGVYLGLNAPLDPKNRYRNKVGLIFDEPRGKLAPEFLSFFGPIERAFTVAPASTIRYVRTNQGVHFVTSKDPDSASDERCELLSKHLGQAVDESFGALFSCGLFGFETEEFAKSVLQNWMVNPGEIHSATWFDELHGEGFGTSEVHYVNLAPVQEWFDPDGERKIAKAIQASLWPEGFLRWTKVSRLVKLEGGNNGI